MTAIGSGSFEAGQKPLARRDGEGENNRADDDKQEGFDGVEKPPGEQEDAEQKNGSRGDADMDGFLFHNTHSVAHRTRVVAPMPFPRKPRYSSAPPSPAPTTMPDAETRRRLRGDACGDRSDDTLNFLKRVGVVCPVGHLFRQRKHGTDIAGGRRDQHLKLHQPA